MLELPGDTQDRFKSWVYEQAIGKPLLLDASPTSSGGELSEGSLGFDGTNLFITISGTTYKITLTAV